MSLQAHDVARIQVWAPQVAGFGGGITEFSRQLIRVLAKSYSVRVVSKLDPSHTIGSTFVSGAGGWPSKLQSLIFCLKALIQAIIWRPQLIVCTHLNFGPVAYWLQRLLKLPYVLVAHGVDVHKDLSPARIRALRCANRLIGVSRHSGERLLALPGILADQISYLPNTFDETRFITGQADTELRKRYRIPPERRIILTLGRLTAAEGYKGYDVIVQGLAKVIKEVPDSHYLICGRGDDTPRIQSMVNERQLAERVTLTGFVQDEELPAHYRLADLFAMPSTGEGFGIVFLEAMACGVPVLAGNRDGSVDALANGELGCLVDPLDVDAVASGLISMLKKQGPPWWYDPEELRSKVLSRFGREVFESTLLQIIQRVDTPSGGRVASVHGGTGLFDG